MLVIDVNVAFCGDRPEPIEDSVKRWRNSCGLVAWEAADRIAVLLQGARAKRVPIVYTTGFDPRPDGFDSGRGADKNARRAEDLSADRAGGNEIIPAIAPRSGDLVVRKPKYSAFFGTPLLSYLIDLQVDTLLVCGTATSGCVRATVVDAYQYNYRVSVIEECTFDRIESSHAVSLFDMHLKHADVVSLEEACRYLDGVVGGLFDARMPSLRGARASR